LGIIAIAYSRNIGIVQLQVITVHGKTGKRKLTSYSHILIEKPGAFDAEIKTAFGKYVISFFRQVLTDRDAHAHTHFDKTRFFIDGKRTVAKWRMLSIFLE
jgi:hypothetical protein